MRLIRLIKPICNALFPAEGALPNDRLGKYGGNGGAPGCAKTYLAEIPIPPPKTTMAFIFLSAQKYECRKKVWKKEMGFGEEGNNLSSKGFSLFPNSHTRNALPERAITLPSL